MRALLLLTFAITILGQFYIQPDPTAWREWLGEGGFTPKQLSKSQYIHHVMNRLFEAGKEFVGENYTPDQQISAQSEQYPFFGFIPLYVGSVMAGGAPLIISTPCFSKVTITASDWELNKASVSVDSSGGTGIGCQDDYLLATISAGGYQSSSHPGPVYLTWDRSNYTNAENWDINTKGIRVFRFLEDRQSNINNLNQTLALFANYGTAQVDPAAAALNVQFLRDYAWKNMTARSIQEVSLNESQIFDGDFFGVIRLDGLDPVLAWAMGSVTGHTTIALRDPSGVLQVCESTTSSAYWPVDGIQCTPYQQWLTQAKAAGYQVTHAPLSSSSRAAFNSTAAWNYFKSVEGYEYGFVNQFWGWLDTDEQNYPCLPPDFKACMVHHHFEIITGWLDKYDPDITYTFMKQSLNARFGTNYQTLAEIYQYAQTQKTLNVPQLYETIELDSYVYNTTRYGKPAMGPSMVCCVFVCAMWKNAGLYTSLDNEVNCGETTNWDDYALHIFDDNYQRPPQCVAADPQNPNCQLEGAYTLIFDAYDSKTPVQHMAENCPSQNPYYKRPSNC